jgi:hypothetical protein
MALQGNLNADRNVYVYAFPTCYARAVEVRSDYLTSYITVWYYADAAARAANAVTVLVETITLPTADLPVVSPPNPIVSAYEYMKTLPQFAGWIDV